MQETPIPLLAKAPVYGLQVHIGRSGLSIGDEAQVTLDAERKIIVTAMVRQRRFGVFKLSRLRQLGHLGPVVDRILLPHLESGQDLRVRVVGITPEHLSGDRGPEVFVSVWGAPGKFRTRP